MEQVNELRTMSRAAALTTPDIRSAETGESTVHTTQRSTEDIEIVVKANDKHPSHKEKQKIVKTNKNLNLGLMYVTTVSKVFEIQFPIFFFFNIVFFILFACENNIKRANKSFANTAHCTLFTAQFIPFNLQPTIYSQQH